jgi:hypothetical protein
MTKNQSQHRSRLGVKTVFGLLLAVVAAGALAVASPAQNTGSSLRSGELHVAKECPDYHGLAGEHCTIVWSNLNALKGGSNVVYAQAVDFRAGVLDSDLVIDGPGDNAAFGHVVLDLVTSSGSITFSGGTGVFSGFHARVAVTYNTGDNLWHWDGTYNFVPPGHDD